VIRSHPTSLAIYEKKLVDNGLLRKEEIAKLKAKVMSILNEEFENSKDYVPSKRDWLAAFWAGFKGPEQLSKVRNTGYEAFGFAYVRDIIMIQ
jgi:2-oxoglutarate dehydrogenase E1 component